MTECPRRARPAESGGEGGEAGERGARAAGMAKHHAIAAVQRVGEQAGGRVEDDDMAALRTMPVAEQDPGEDDPAHRFRLHAVVAAPAALVEIDPVAGLPGPGLTFRQGQAERAGALRAGAIEVEGEGGLQGQEQQERRDSGAEAAENEAAAD